MNQSSSTPSLVLGLALALTAPAALAQISEPKSPSPNRFSLNSRIGYNISARFSSTLGSPAASNPGPPTGGGIDRFYDDGFVRRDASGNQDGLTWFWGYANNSQVPGNDTIILNSSTAAAGGSFERHANGDPQLGLELAYGRVLGEIGPVQWGFQGAFGWTDLVIRDTLQVATSLTRTTDTFSLGGITPPTAPYSGTFEGPGPVIADAPMNRAVTPLGGGATLFGERALHANLYGFRLGPFVEVPICRWLTFAF